MPIYRYMLLCLAFLGFALSAQADDMPTFTLVAKEGRFFPEVVSVPANVRFRLSIKNEGKDPEEFESLPLRKESVLAPGVTRTLVFAPLKPGSYPFFGDFHPATAKGRIEAK
jgi:hypothetical protein